MFRILYPMWKNPANRAIAGYFACVLFYGNSCFQLFFKNPIFKGKLPLVNV